MPTLNIYVTGHKVTIDSGQRLSSGSNKWDKLKFTFDASWDGLTKYASLSGDKVNFTRTQLDSNNECTITDTQIPTEGILCIGAYGTGSNDVRATTSLVRVDVAAGSALGTVPLTQSQYNNLIDQVTALNTDLTQLKSKVQTLENNAGTGSSGSTSYTLPVATSTTLGGVKPVAKTSAMTQEVGVDSAGKLYTAPSASASNASNSGTTMPARISFIDDDGKAEEYSVLYPFCTTNNVPYMMAVPGAKIGVNTYITQSQAETMFANDLISIGFHMNADTPMTEVNRKELQAVVDAWYDALEPMDITLRRVPYIYAHGSWTKDNIQSVVRKNFPMGFTTTKGINMPPFDTYHMMRVGLFPTDGSFTLENAKAYVDKVAETGGWLIFFTHCYMATFDIDGLQELVNYINTKGVAIDSVDNVITDYGNLLDEGYFLRTSPSGAYYKMIDYTGKVYEAGTKYSYTYNQINVDLSGSGSSSGGSDSGSGGTDTPTTDWTQLTFTTRDAYYIGKETSANNCGIELQAQTSTSYVLSERIDISAYSTLKLSGYAAGGYGKYSFLDASGSLVQCYWSDSDAAGVSGIFTDEIVSVPSGAKYLLLSGSTSRQLPIAYAK